MKTLAVNHDNDLYIVNGGLAFATDAKCQSVIVDTIIKTQVGELQFNEDVGIDYAGTVMQNHTLIKPWAMEVQGKVRNLPFVRNIQKFDYRFNTELSRVEWAMLIENTDGEVFSVGSSREMKNGSVVEVGVDWNKLSGKPSGMDSAIETIEKMRTAAGDKPYMTSKSTLGDVKEVVNDVAITTLSEP